MLARLFWSRKFSRKTGQYFPLRMGFLLSENEVFCTLNPLAG
jgi:hypothetical protein